MSEKAERPLRVNRVTLAVRRSLPVYTSTPDMSLHRSNRRFVPNKKLMHCSKQHLYSTSSASLAIARFGTPST